MHSLLNLTTNAAWEVGVSNVLRSVIFPQFSEKTLDTYGMSRSYLPGVDATELRWHVANVNVVFENITYIAKSTQLFLTENLANRALVDPTPAQKTQAPFESRSIKSAPNDCGQDTNVVKYSLCNPTNICTFFFLIRFAYIIDFRYIAVIYNTIVHTAQQLQWQNFGQTLH